MPRPKIGFIGLGAMGMGMALHLLEDGFLVSGFDINPKALETLSSKGGMASSSPLECATNASFLICMVANAAQTDNVLFDKSTGAVFGLPQHATVILCSTVAPGLPREILQRFNDEFQRPDIQLLDCPVSGGTVRAAQGTLTILASGLRETLSSARPILESMAEKIYEIEGGGGGELGAATKVKLINQHLAGIHIAVSCEAMGFAASLGLNTRDVYESVLGSLAHSWMFENRVPHMLTNDWTPHSALDIFVKDMGIVASEGANQKFPLFLASAAQQLYLVGAQMGFGKEDDAGLVRVFIPQKTPSLVASATQNQKKDSSDQHCGVICDLLQTVHTAAAVEAMGLAAKLKLSTSQLISIISDAAGASNAFKAITAKIATKDFQSGGTILQSYNKLKDIVAIATKHGYPLQLTNTTLQMYELAIVQGLGEQNEAALSKLWT